jgi:sugar phosphate permease
VLLRFFTWRQFYYLLSAAYVISALLFLFSGKEIKVPGRRRADLRSVLKDKSLWILAAIWTFAGGGAFMAIYQIIPLYLTKELAFGLDRANTIFGLSRLGGAFFGVMVGFAADRFDLRRSLFAEVAAVGISILFISHPNVRVVEVALFLQGTIGGMPEAKNRRAKHGESGRGPM